MSELEFSDVFPNFDHDKYLAELEGSLSPDELYAVDLVHKKLWVLYPNEGTKNQQYEKYQQDNGSRKCAIMIVHGLKQFGVKMEKRND